SQVPGEAAMLAGLTLAGTTAACGLVATCVLVAQAARRNAAATLGEPTAIRSNLPAIGRRVSIVHSLSRECFLPAKCSALESIANVGAAVQEVAESGPPARASFGAKADSSFAVALGRSIGQVRPRREEGRHEEKSRLSHRHCRPARHLGRAAIIFASGS